jgi:hypothetical protein
MTDVERRRSVPKMHSIAEVVALALPEDPVEMMRKYIGFTFNLGQLEYEIFGVSLIPLRHLGHRRSRFTKFFERRYGRRLEFLDLPVFACSGPGARPRVRKLDDPDPNTYLCYGSIVLPPEICDLSTGRVIM